MALNKLLSDHTDWAIASYLIVVGKLLLIKEFRELRSFRDISDFKG